MFYFSVINTVKFISGPGLSVLACPWRLCVRYDDLTVCLGSIVLMFVCVRACVRACVCVQCSANVSNYCRYCKVIHYYTTSKSTFASP